MKRFCILLLVMVLGFATASTYPEWSLNELYTRADIVAFGTVEHVQTVDGKTEITLTQIDWFIGETDELTLTWHTADTRNIANWVLPEIGDEILAFVYTERESLSPIVGHTRGLFTVTNDVFGTPQSEYLALSDTNELFISTEQREASPAADVRAALQAPTFTDGNPAVRQTEEPEVSGQLNEVLTVTAELWEHEALTRAFELWNEALPEGSSLTAIVGDDPQFRAGDATTLGDAVSLTSRAEAALVSEMNLSANAAHLVNAFMFEIGVHIGVEPGDSPVMQPWLPSTERTITAVDVAAALQRVSRVPGDLNNDGVIDFHDLIILARHYGERGINVRGDINNDGVVDELDAAIIEESYTFTQPD